MKATMSHYVGKACFTCLAALFLLSGSLLHAEDVIVSDTFNRADSDDIGALDNGLGGEVADVYWGEVEDGATWWQVQGNSLHVGNSTLNADVYLKKAFVFSELGGTFAVEFTLDWNNSDKINHRAQSILIGHYTNLLSTLETPEVKNSDGPIGVLLRSDDKIVVWDDGANGGVGEINDLVLNDGNAHTVRVQIATSEYSNGTTGTLTVYIDGVQFTDLRNDDANTDAAEYEFQWGPEQSGGEMTIALEANLHGGTEARTIDDFKILGEYSLKDEDGTIFYFR